MRVNTMPSWVKLTFQQHAIFDIIYSSGPSHAEFFYRIVDSAQLRFPGISKPRVSDVLNNLRNKELIVSGPHYGEWTIPETVCKKLAISSAEQAKVLDEAQIKEVKDAARKAAKKAIRAQRKGAAE